MDTEPAKLPYPPMHSVPERLAVFEGGFLGQSFRFSGDMKSLMLEVFDPGQGTSAEVYRSTPSAESWERFRLAVIDVDLARWKKDYSDPPIMDGSQWSVLIEYPDHQFRSAGSNAWPDDDAFRDLWEALVVLVDYPASKMR